MNSMQVFYPGFEDSQQQLVYSTSKANIEHRYYKFPYGPLWKCVVTSDLPRWAWVIADSSDLERCQQYEFVAC
jgi:hypothetical protein